MDSLDPNRLSVMDIYTRMKAREELTPKYNDWVRERVEEYRIATGDPSFKRRGFTRHREFLDWLNAWHEQREPSSD
jgi:hypothetical protein